MTREEAIKELQHFDAFTPTIIKTAIEKAIEALEQPEIIYCKDCKYGTIYKNWHKDKLIYCAMSDMSGFLQNHYCSYAERKDD